ncbi:putative pericentriolar material 1 protein isoform X2 [Apostichopus japonicus]|uniref:Putative pericentriolar material 1 protein isoform X2 n=1 Tax=Stichopus japonicus TaxID=307972 RepID=A0A2G8LGI8_STIJA|nr:putative pericentriolar material 1 protein isoform X2 [Apostichopus japonicus]
MGTYASDSEILSDVERDEDIMSVDSEVTGSFGLDTGELHEQYSSLLAKYNPKEDSSHSRDSSAEDLSVNGLISSSNNSQGEEQMEALAGLQQQHDLLRKMLQQQEELRNLQNRQTSLMKLQEQIESRLADNETSTEATPSEVSHQTEDSKTMTETSTIPERDPQSETESERYKVALQDLRKRTLLRMLNEDRDERLHQLQADTRMDLQQREQEQVQLMNHEQKDLQEKLQHLQQKKDDMDLLLHQLHSMAAGAGIMDAASSIDPASEAEGSQIGRNFASGGGGDGVKLEGTSVGSDSLMKLQEVRHRLTELQGLVQEYQGTTQESTNNGHDANYEDPELMSNLRKLERGELIGRYRGIHVNNHNQASTQTVGPPLINQSEDETQGTPSVTEEETETENESEQSSVPVAWAEDPELREKFRKLETAKQKLRELQKLVSIVQELPEAAMGLPDDLAELAMSLTEKYQREAYYEAKMRQQRRELEKLMEERGQLLNVQRQLKELNQKLPPISMINNFTQDQHQLHARYLPPTNPQDSLTPSRDEVYAEMRRHKILQEELRQKKRELAALVAKVKRNKLSTDDMNDLEDNDLFSRVSMRSADVTAAATWGGSSQMSDYEEDDDETNDAYRGRRGLAEEEEEEEVEGNSIAMTSDTYTVEEPRFNPGRPSILANESDYDESLLEMHGIRYPGRFPRQQYLNPRQENLRAPEDLVEDMSHIRRTTSVFRSRWTISKTSWKTASESPRPWSKTNMP